MYHEYYPLQLYGYGTISNVFFATMKENNGKLNPLITFWNCNYHNSVINK